jgi:hypothetical protein
MSFTISGRVHGTIPYNNGTAITLPHIFGNVVDWTPSPAHFGNVDAAGIGNPVQWNPSPAQFGTKLPGGPATVTLSGAGSGVTTCDEWGSYSFTGLAAGTYTVTPSLAGYVFAPISQTFTITDSRNGISFAAMAGE